ncbi:hypothetical protein BKA67DRAFT_508094, partial [Truncatella angustata]
AAPTKKSSAKSSARAQEDPTTEEPTRPVLSAEAAASQQKVLGIFQTAFDEALSSAGFAQTLQEVKSALYDRDFGRAFGREEYLEVYAARWSPTRALAYAAALEGLREWLGGIAASETTPARVRSGSKTLKLLALGGGTAELAAFASFLSTSPGTSGDITLLDTGPWGGAVNKLRDSLLIAPPIYKYASAAAKAANTPLVGPGQLQHTFLQQDILALSADKLREILGVEPLLVTLLFTLNELYTGGGIGKTTSFLRSLSKAVPAGSLLLVVDSPGSYSEAAVGGKEKKKYPMSWLMNHTLEEIEEGCQWEKLEENESVWFRLADDLKYPIQLENMRYQIHLYR